MWAVAFRGTEWSFEPASSLPHGHVPSSHTYTPQHITIPSKLFKMNDHSFVDTLHFPSCCKINGCSRAPVGACQRPSSPFQIDMKSYLVINRYLGILSIGSSRALHRIPSTRFITSSNHQTSSSGSYRSRLSKIFGFCTTLSLSFGTSGIYSFALFPSRSPLLNLPPSLISIFASSISSIFLSF